MAAQAQPSEVLTPRKTNCLGNICIICGFSFVNTFIDTSGKKVTKKYFDKKLKLTDERKQAIITTLGPIEVDLGGDTGVCQKCFRAVERLNKIEKEATELRCDLKRSADNVKDSLMISLPSPKRLTGLECKTKRTLCSPGIQQPRKKVTPLLPITYVQPVYVLPFSDITNTGQSTAKPCKAVRRSLGTCFSEPIDTVTLQGEVEVS